MDETILPILTVFAPELPTGSVFNLDLGRPFRRCVLIKLDPQTRVGSLLRAIPSAAVTFEKFGISTGPSEGKSLQELCMRHGIALEEFLRSMDEIDWNEESGQYRPVYGNGNTTRQGS